MYFLIKKHFKKQMQPHSPIKLIETTSQMLLSNNWKVVLLFFSNLVKHCLQSFYKLCNYKAIRFDNLK